MKYGKLEAGELIASPNPLNIVGMKIYDPPSPLYLAAVYLPRNYDWSKFALVSIQKE